MKEGKKAESEERPAKTNQQHEREREVRRKRAETTREVGEGKEAKNRQKTTM